MCDYGDDGFDSYNGDSVHDMWVDSSYLNASGSYYYDYDDGYVYYPQEPTNHQSTLGPYSLPKPPKTKQEQYERCLRQVRYYHEHIEYLTKEIDTLKIKIADPRTDYKECNYAKRRLKALPGRIESYTLRMKRAQAFADRLYEAPAFSTISTGGSSSKATVIIATALFTLALVSMIVCVICF
ncbi:MAG: hypothetical protein HFJ94_03790 [Muribaculaceae bacterium]|nr:hypothetical protein [Muribaculaceae bacterium]